jgi:hypothetical protein
MQGFGREIRSSERIQENDEKLSINAVFKLQQMDPNSYFLIPYRAMLRLKYDFT